MEDQTSMYNICVEKINEARFSSRPKDKLICLEQVKEIIFHRAPSLMPIVLPDIMTFLAETSNAVKKYVTDFFSETVKISIDTHNNPSLSLLNYLKFVDSIVSDNIYSEGLVKRVIDEFSDKYDVIILQIANNMSLDEKSSAISNSSSASGGGGSSKSSSSSNIKEVKADPKEFWKKFCEVTKKLESLMASNGSTEIRSSILHFMEVSILFGIPPPAQKASNDPRRRNAAAAVSSSSSKTCDLIPASHLIIDKASLTSEAETLFYKLFIWGSSNGPTKRPFDPSLMCKLVVVLTLISEGRPSHIIKEIDNSNIATATSQAITSLVQSKNSLCQRMSSQERAELSRAISKLLSVLRANNGDITSVTAVLNELNKMGASSSDAPPVSTSSLGKRANADNEEDIDFSKLKDSAQVSLDERMKRARADAASKIASSSDAIGNVSMPVDTNTIYPFTELSPDLFDFSTISDVSPSVIVKASFSTSYSGSNPISHVVDPTSRSDNFQEVLSDMSYKSLVRLLTSFDKLQNYGKQALYMQVQLANRLAIKLAQDAKMNASCPLSILVPIVHCFQSIPTENFDLSTIPQSIYLPKSIWCLISYVFHVDDKAYKNLAIGNQHILDKLPLLFCLLNTLHSIDNKQLYNEICLVIVTKFLSNGADKNFTVVRKELSNFIFKIPYIVPACIDLFRALLYTGSRTHGVMGECLSLLCQIASKYITEEISVEAIREVLFNENEGLGKLENYELRIGYMALKYVLLSTLSLNHEISTKAIASLRSEVITKNAISKKIIEEFAKYCVSYLAPPDAVAYLISREHLRSPLTPSMTPLASTSVGATVSKMEVSSAAGGGSSSGDGMDVDGVAAASSSTTADVLGRSSSLPPHGSVNRSSLSTLLPHETDLFYKVFSKKVSEIADETELKLFLKRAVNLLIQISTSGPIILLSLFDLYATCSAICEQQVEIVNEVLVNYSSILAFVKDELDTLLESFFRNRADVVIDLFLGADPLAYPLIEWCLYSLHKQFMEILPTENLVAKVKQIISVCMPVSVSASSTTAAVVSNDMESNDKDSSSSKDKEPSEYTLTASTVKIFIPILGSLSPDCLLFNLPTIIKTIGDNQDSLLEKAFWRIIESRPPPLKRDRLLLALFRMDFKTHGIDRKVYLSSIETFLNAKNQNSVYLLSNVACQFDCNVFEDVMKQLLEDPIVPVGFMYSCIKLASRELRIKDFIYRDAIPGLLRREVYAPAKNMKQLFDGIKSVFATFDAKDLSPAVLSATVKSLFSVPITITRDLVSPTIDLGAKDSKKNNFRVVLSKYLKSITSKEREDLAVGDADKLKILQELVV